MKHTLKSRAIVLAAVLATGAGLAGCSKEKAPGEAPHNTETTVYATAQNQILDAGAVEYFPHVMPGFTSTAPAWYQIGITLTGTKEDMKDRWISRDTLYIKKVFSPLKITGIDVILLTDYDKEHPKGASIADQFDIESSGGTRVDMQEFFRTGGVVEWKEGGVCLLIARTFPSDGYNYSEFFDRPRPTTSGHRGFGAVLRLTLEDNTVIETKPSISTVYYEPGAGS